MVYETPNRTTPAPSPSSGDGENGTIVPVMDQPLSAGWRGELRKRQNPKGVRFDGEAGAIKLQYAD